MERRVGVREELNVRVSHKVSKWIRHVERLSEERMMKYYIYTIKNSASVRLSVRDAVNFSVFLLSFLYVNIELNLSSEYS